MANLERTAYPRFARVITARDLAQQYTPDENEVGWVSARSRTGRLGCWFCSRRFSSFITFPRLKVFLRKS
jgi:hypothetical protein